MNIEKAIDDCLIGLDLSSLDGMEIYVSRGWAEKLEKEPLAGFWPTILCLSRRVSR